MKKFTSFTKYSADEKTLPEIGKILFGDDREKYPENWQEICAGIQFLMSEEGVDWYAAQRQFSDDTMKIMYDESGVICSFSRDASTLFPLGLSVTEIAPDNWPDGVTAREWRYENGSVTRIPVDYVAIASAEKSRLLKLAADRIAPLQYAVDLGEETDDERAGLLAWKKFSIAVNRVDITTAPVIEWPMPPEAL